VTLPAAFTYVLVTVFSAGKDLDSEDWRIGCLKFSFAITGINCILKYIKIENSLNIPQ